VHAAASARARGCDWLSCWCHLADVSHAMPTGSAAKGLLYAQPSVPRRADIYIYFSIFICIYIYVCFLPCAGRGRCSHLSCAASTPARARAPIGLPQSVPHPTPPSRGTYHSASPPCRSPLLADALAPGYHPPGARHVQGHCAVQPGPLPHGTCARMTHTGLRRSVGTSRLMRGPWGSI